MFKSKSSGTRKKSTAKRRSGAGTRPPKASKTKAKKADKSWLHTGARAHATFEKERQRQELNRKASSQGRRFWMKPGEKCKVTFLDGKIDSDGMLDIPFYYDHRVKLHGRWQNIVCPKSKDERLDCPVCKGGDQPRYTGVCTVIDHRKIKATNSPGKVYHNEPKLYAITPFSMTALQELAIKRGGLAGWRVEIMRTGDRKPQIGDVWDFEKKIPLARRKRLYADEETGKLPIIDYGEALKLLEPEELRALGFGEESDGDADDADLDADLD